MLIETKQIILLSAKEQESFDTVRNLMLVLSSKTNDPKLESIAKHISDELKEISHFIDIGYCVDDEIK